jgi:hypothetical protein
LSCVDGWLDRRHDLLSFVQVARSNFGHRW